ncbi:polysaccharide deacetylase family protein [Mesorhizobium sp. SP-1A]|uniref:polysaccharide deacetylase family protein n=1 Tax=Mesorhizobium sp. SP-1A TaxID=3077840 RepID=UPI0028F6CF52|nr:polysaccharide deacetylase family protein [Mesorhizobium sp. SP-1A]
MSFKSTARRTLKYAAIRGGLEAVALTRAGALWPSAGGRGVVLTLHHVRPAEPHRFAPNALLSVTPQFLDEAIRACIESGLVPVALEDLPRLLADPADERRFVAFTLDDGYRNNAEHAAPVFRRHGVPYTIFITRGFVEGTRSAWWETAEALAREAIEVEFDFGAGVEQVPMRTLAEKLAAFDRFSRFVQTTEEDQAIGLLDRLAEAHGIDPAGIIDQLVMDASELRELSRDPLVRFGAHTLTHVNLRRVDDARLRAELTGSACAVAEFTGREPQSLAYPYGYAAAVGEREFKAAADAGFKVAVTTQPGVLGPHNLQRPTAYGRVSLNGLYQNKRLVKALLTGIPFRLM